MIVSHRYRLVFVHLPKAAGTSITRALAPLCTAPGDVAREDNEGKHLTAAEIRERYFSPRSDARWWDYLSFAVVRNPWERIHSDWHFVQRFTYAPAAEGTSPWSAKLRRCRDYRSFAQFVRSEYLPQVKINFWRRWCIAGELDLVRLAVRYERLADEWQWICRAAGLGKVELPRILSFDRGDYRRAYDDNLAEEVGRLCGEEIERFGYTFEGGLR